MLQQAGGSLVVTVADAHRAAAVKAVQVHLLQNTGQHPGLAAGLVEKVDLSVRGAAAQHPHVQRAGNKAHHLAHPPGFGQVLKAGQSKQDVPGVVVLGQGAADLLKTLSFADQPVGQHGGLRQRAGAAQRVQDKDVFVRVLVQHHLAGALGGVVTAGQVVADGQGDHVVRLQKLLGPFLRAGAGGGTAALVVGHGFQHLAHAQRGQVNELPLAHPDLERHQPKLYAGAQIFQLTDLARRIRNDHPGHSKPSRGASANPMPGALPKAPLFSGGRPSPARRQTALHIFSMAFAANTISIRPVRALRQAAGL